MIGAIHTVLIYGCCFMYLAFHCTLMTHAQGTELHERPYIIVLGNIQDAGSPHIGCEKACCASLHENPDPSRKVVCLGIVDPVSEKAWIIEATPDMPSQLRTLREHATFMDGDVPDGVFITHAHIGHYTGLMYFGREALGASSVPVHVMPRMKRFLEESGPWSQLVELENIKLNELAADQPVKLTPEISVTPFLVPHRDEFSETAGYLIAGPSRSVLFIPDIDKWQKWERSIAEEIRKVDHALIDATFYDTTELPGRDMSEIPHPFVVESMELFNSETESFIKKVRFIHLNHTNPLLDQDSEEFENVNNKGYRVAMPGDISYL